METRKKNDAAKAAVEQRGRPRSKVADQAILAATVEILEEKGLDGLTFEAIASRAGVGRPTIYRRWKRKEDLVAEAMESRREHLTIPDSGNLVDDLQTIGESLVRVVSNPASWSYFSLYLTSIQRSEAVRETFWSSYFSDRLDLLRPVFARGVERGELPASSDVDLLMTVLLGAWLNLYLMAMIQGKRPGRGDLRKVTDFVIGRATGADGAVSR